MSGNLEAALRYAAAGIPVIPLHAPIERQNRLVCSCPDADRCRAAAKHPFASLAPHGLRDASTDASAVERWFSPRPWLNLGIVTGAASGLIVLDVDPRHGGDESLARLERENGPLPPTWRTITGGGGEHVLYRHPGGTVPCSAGGHNRLGAGLDIRGDGGYIAAAPSLHISGRRYAWSVDHHPDDTRLAEAPAWLVERISGRPGPAVARPSSYWEAMAGGVPEGGRNDAIAQIAGHLFRRRVDPGLAVALVAAFNATTCRPPLDRAEVDRTLDSIAGREAKRREGNGGRNAAR